MAKGVDHTDDYPLVSHALYERYRSTLESLSERNKWSMDVYPASCRVSTGSRNIILMRNVGSPLLEIEKKVQDRWRSKRFAGSEIEAALILLEKS